MEDVPRARRLVKEAVTSGLGAEADDVELVVSELVTNAVLHGAPPVTIALWDIGRAVRVEVGDHGQMLPIVGRASPEMMTGRGLSLVAALSTGWGVVEQAGGGKVIWAEVADSASVTTAPTDPADLEALVAAWAQWDKSDEPIFTVRLGAVPTEFLIAAKAYIDNLVREFTLARADSAASGTPMSPVVTRLIETVTVGFAEPRAEIKRQAIAAARQGWAETDLVLRLPASAADAAAAYLAALDEADRYARSAWLLTLVTPPSHRVFRHWYLSSLVEQLRSHARGELPPQPPTFADALAIEVNELAETRDAVDRMHLLENVTGQLASALTAEQAAATVAANCVEFLGALVVRVYLLADDGILRLIVAHGGAGGLMERYREFPLDADLPASIVVRTGEPMLLRSRDQIERYFPPLAGAFPVERILHLTPLKAAGRAFGCLTLTFPAESRIEETGQMSFVTALADALSQALVRWLPV
jgi:hypothetical protein